VYSELVFTDLLFPDFRRAHLFDAICEYQRRDRRFGAIGDD
jgi:undecaprenyl diphosphate synthase